MGKTCLIKNGSQNHPHKRRQSGVSAWKSNIDNQATVIQCNFKGYMIRKKYKTLRDVINQVYIKKCFLFSLIDI